MKLSTSILSILYTRSKMSPLNSTMPGSQGSPVQEKGECSGHQPQTCKDQAGSNSNDKSWSSTWKVPFQVDNLLLATSTWFPCKTTPQKKHQPKETLNFKTRAPTTTTTKKKARYATTHILQALTRPKPELRFGCLVFGSSPVLQAREGTMLEVVHRFFCLAIASVQLPSRKAGMRARHRIQPKHHQSRTEGSLEARRYVSSRIPASNESVHFPNAGDLQWLVSLCFPSGIFVILWFVFGSSLVSHWFRFSFPFGFRLASLLVPRQKQKKKKCLKNNTPVVRLASGGGAKGRQPPASVPEGIDPDTSKWFA